MHKIAILFIFIAQFCWGQNSKYRYVSICGQEGIIPGFYFRMGEEKLKNILKGFESKMHQEYPEYNDYYRVYNNINRKAFRISVYLVPKSIVSQENQEKKKYRVVLNEQTKKVFYNFKTDAIKKPYFSQILPEL